MLFGVFATSVLQSSTDGLFDLLCWDVDGFGDCYCDRVCGTGEYGHSDGAAYILGGLRLHLLDRRCTAARRDGFTPFPRFGQRNRVRRRRESSLTAPSFNVCTPLTTWRALLRPRAGSECDNIGLDVCSYRAASLALDANHWPRAPTDPPVPLARRLERPAVRWWLFRLVFLLMTAPLKP